MHRLLAACIGADTTYPELLDKTESAKLTVNLNYRNRMAQYAGRASVALNTHVNKYNTICIPYRNRIYLHLYFKYIAYNYSCSSEEKFNKRKDTFCF